MIRVFIGYDPRETDCYHVLAHSIMEKASQPVSISPISLTNLSNLYYRTRDPKQSNDFSFSRFFVPYLCGYEGHAIFMDCDMMMREDIADLWSFRSDHYAVQCVKHDYIPRKDQKYLNNGQTVYPKKNWSSMMIFNNDRCRQLNVPYVNTASGLELHQFKWTNDESVGEIPPEWNYLVDEDNQAPTAKLVHWTNGGPWFVEYGETEFAEEWFETRRRARRTDQATGR